MAYTYTSWSVAFGEQPSASKWNIIGTNMASFDERIGSGLGSTSSSIWWEELGRTTLGVAGDTISLTPITARKYLRIHVNANATGGNVRFRMRFNNDSSNNYAFRNSQNTGAEGTTSSTSSITVDIAGAISVFQMSVIEVINIAAQEKLIHYSAVSQTAAGAGNVPTRTVGAGKWANTSTQITRVDIINDSTGDFAIGSELVVLGHD